jgi:hypothetical protein
LALVNNPFIVPLKFSFQNPDKLYLVMSFGMLFRLVEVIGASSNLLFSKWRGTVLSSTARGQIR